MNVVTRLIGIHIKRTFDKSYNIHFVCIGSRHPEIEPVCARADLNAEATRRPIVRTCGLIRVFHVEYKRNLLLPSHRFRQNIGRMIIGMTVSVRNAVSRNRDLIAADFHVVILGISDRVCGNRKFFFRSQNAARRKYVAVCCFQVSLNAVFLSCGKFQRNDFERFERDFGEGEAFAADKESNVVFRGSGSSAFEQRVPLLVVDIVCRNRNVTAVAHDFEL